jgi:uncharacterized FlaG/YvyC family protein
MEIRSVSGQDMVALAQARVQTSGSRAAADTGQSQAAARPSTDTVKPEVRQATEEAPPIVENTSTRMKLDGASKRVVAQIVNQSNEVIKQIPPQDLLDIAAKFKKLDSVLFNVKV